jgi:phenylacetate-coenzyme A ligase PaaK-like adenylate-forming protein
MRTCAAGEYFCFVDRAGAAGVDRIDVRVEVFDGADRAACRADLEARLKEVLGVRVAVTPVGQGELDRYTGTSLSSKVRRLLDRRG